MPLEVSPNSETVIVTVERPVKGLVLWIDDDNGADIESSDNGLDVVPGDPQTVVMRRHCESRRKDQDGRSCKIVFKYFSNAVYHYHIG